MVDASGVDTHLQKGIVEGIFLVTWCKKTLGETNTGTYECVKVEEDVPFPWRSSLASCACFAVDGVSKEDQGFVGAAVLVLCDDVGGRPGFLAGKAPSERGGTVVNDDVSGDALVVERKRGEGGEDGAGDVDDVGIDVHYVLVCFISYRGSVCHTRETSHLHLNL